MIDLDVSRIHQYNWQTKEGWAQFVADEVEDPGRLTRRELEALDDVARVQYCHRRLDFMINGPISLTPDVKAIQDEMRQRMIANVRKRGGKFGIIIDGVPNAGKSTTATRLAREFERRRRSIDITRPAGYMPVMYVSTPSDCTPKSLLVQFANFMGTPVRSTETSAHLLARLVDNVVRCGTELMIIDEIHNLRQDRQGAADATNYLKQLSESCSATFLYVGANVAKSGLLAGDWSDQVTTRFRTMTVEPYALFGKGQSGRDRWSALLEDLERNAHLVDQQPGDILEWAEPLLEATDGRVGEAAGLIQLAAIEAMESGRERMEFRGLADELQLLRKTRAAHTRRVSA